MNELEERIVWFREKRPGYSRILDFYEAVWELQNESFSRIGIEPVYISDGEKESRLHQGLPLLNTKDFRLDIAASKELFKAIAQLGPKAPADLTRKLLRISEGVADETIDWNALFQSFPEKEFLKATADRLALDLPALSFIVRASLEPSLRANAIPFKSAFGLDVWSKGSCPVCGSYPRMLALRDQTGKRYAFCSFCGFEWRIPRLLCPFCDDAGRDSLRYLFSDEGPGYRIDVCDCCRNYIKVLDLRENAYEPFPPLEDLMTIHLDLLAEREGFKRAVPVF